MEAQHIDQMVYGLIKRCEQEIDKRKIGKSVF